MEVGFIGLGKMGYPLAKKLLQAGVKVIAWDHNEKVVAQFQAAGGTGVDGPEKIAASLERKRAIWLMVPAGKAIDDVLHTLTPTLDAGDVIIDGGNSFYKDSVRRAHKLVAKSIHFIDCGTSGGLSGAEEGACLMVGGENEAIMHCEKVFKILALENGYLHCGPAGSGHFVKMIHNGIEYGMMQAIGEGFDLMQHSRFDLDLKEIARLWSHGSVIRSWLMDLAGNALEKDPGMKSLQGVIQHSGEGKWAAQTALEFEIPAPVITHSLLARFSSLQSNSFGARMVAALRKEFGGHDIIKS